MTTTEAAKTPVRRVSKSAGILSKMRDAGEDLQIINKSRSTLKEGQNVVVLSADGVGFPGYVYGFERLSDGGLLTYITLD